MTRISGIVVWLTALWLLLWGDLTWANLSSGLLVAVLVVTLSRLPRLARRDEVLRLPTFVLKEHPRGDERKRQLHRA